MRLTIIGDSISQGLGRKHYNYCNELKCFFEQETKQSLDITNMAITGKTILYANEITDKIKDTNPDVILIFLGSVDAILCEPNVIFRICLYSPLLHTKRRGGGLDND